MSYLKAQEVARRLGVKTGTLARWRRDGKGPAGAFHLSTTCVVYPLEAIEAFLLARQAVPLPTAPSCFAKGGTDDDAPTDRPQGLR